MKDLLRELFLIIEDTISDSNERYEVYRQFVPHISEIDNDILEYLLDNNEEFSDAYEEYSIQAEEYE
jgi:hypothetical protein|tara:strand:- start:12317 stop:12517 length:201 start_codon:yes stop_codon:yes gene_type:complete